MAYLNDDEPLSGTYFPLAGAVHDRTFAIACGSHAETHFVPPLRIQRLEAALA